jgi:DNA-binding transcriptional LysR family regulator
LNNNINMILSRDWLYFIKAAELLNFKRAAHELNISQGAVSQAIQRLEEENSIKLFNRKPGKQSLELTPSGKVILTELLPIENQFKQNILPKAKNINKPLRICCAAQVANLFLECLPNQNSSQLHIYVIPRRGHILTGLNKGHFDFTIMSGPINSKSKQIFGREPFYFMGRKDKFSHLKQLKTLEEVKILMNLFERKPFENKWSNLMEADKSGFFIDDHVSGRELVLAGLVVSTYSLLYFSMDEIKQLAISPILPDWGPVDWKIQAVYDETLLEPHQLELVKFILSRFEVKFKKRLKQIDTYLKSQKVI